MILLPNEYLDFRNTVAPLMPDLRTAEEVGLVRAVRRVEGLRVEVASESLRALVTRWRRSLGLAG